MEETSDTSSRSLSGICSCNVGPSPEALVGVEVEVEAEGLGVVTFTLGAVIALLIDLIAAGRRAGLISFGACSSRETGESKGETCGVEEACIRSSYGRKV